MSILRLSIIASFSVFLALSQWGCDEKKEERREELLLQPPYRAITDSIRMHPERTDFYLSRALLLSQNNLHEWATPDYRKAWELTPDETCGMELSANLMLVNDTLGAVAVLKDCRDKYPDNESFYKRLSEIYAVIGKPALALAEFDALLSRDSTNFIAYFEKGLLQLRLLDTSGAQLSLERSYAMQPITQTALALANIYSMRRDPRVLSLCDAILSKDTTASITDAIFLKGIYYADTRQYEKAIRLFDQCINKDWTFIDAHIERGLVFFEQKRWPEALKSFEKASTVSNTYADAYYWLGRTYESMRQFPQARENYLIALSLEPGFEEAALHMKSLEKDTLPAR